MAKWTERGPSALIRRLPDTKEPAVRMMPPTSSVRLKSKGGFMNRRSFLAFGLSTGMLHAREQIMYPVISEEACPLQRITPVARDGHKGLGFLRKPPGNGRFPVFLIIHPGGRPWPEDDL